MRGQDKRLAARERRLLGIMDGVAPYHQALELLGRKNLARMKPAEAEAFRRRGLLRAATAPGAGGRP